MKNCKDCSFTKCLSRVDYDFSICPVEQKKQEYSNDDENTTTKIIK